MSYTNINNGDTGSAARTKINGIGVGLDTHTTSSGSDVHNLGTISGQSASAVNITGGTITPLTTHSSLSGSDVHNLGTMAKQSASAVNITGGTITPLTAHTSLSGSDVHSLGTMATQSASAVNITSGSMLLTNLRVGNSEGSTYFETDGTMVMSGSATVWDDMFFPLLAGKQGQVDKPAFDSTELGFLFPQADPTQIIYIIAQFPHSMEAGSDVEPHVHWKQNHSGSVVFKIDYKWFPIGGAIPANWTTYTMSTPVVAYTSGSIHQLTQGTSHISGSSIGTVSSLMLIKLYRDDNTFTGNAITYQFDIHIRKDTIGSRTDLAK